MQRARREIYVPVQNQRGRTVSAWAAVVFAHWKLAASVGFGLGFDFGSGFDFALNITAAPRSALRRIPHAFGDGGASNKHLRFRRFFFWQTRDPQHNDPGGRP